MNKKYQISWNIYRIHIAFYDGINAHLQENLNIVGFIA